MKMSGPGRTFSYARTGVGGHRNMSLRFNCFSSSQSTFNIINSLLPPHYHLKQKNFIATNLGLKDIYLSAL
jgi:hypothetical protein